MVLLSPVRANHKERLGSAPYVAWADQVTLHVFPEELRSRFRDVAAGDEFPARPVPPMSVFVTTEFPVRRRPERALDERRGPAALVQGS